MRRRRRVAAAARTRPPRVAGLGGGDAACGLAPRGASGARLGSPRPRPPPLPTAVERSRVRERLRRALPRPAEYHPRRRREKTVRAIECNGCIANARAVAVAAAARGRPASQNGGTGRQPAPPSRTRAPALKGDPRTCRDRSVWPRRPQRPRMTRWRRPAPIDRRGSSCSAGRALSSNAVIGTRTRMCTPRRSRARNPSFDPRFPPISPTALRPRTFPPPFSALGAPIRANPTPFPHHFTHRMTPSTRCTRRTALEKHPGNDTLSAH